MFSATVSDGLMVISWKTKPTPRCIASVTDFGA
jgi:hypothetical protein